VQDIAGVVDTANPDLIAGMPSEMIFQFMAVALNGEKAAGVELTLDIEFPDLEERWLLEIRNGVLRSHATRRVDDPSITLSIDRADFMAALQGRASFPALMRDDRARLAGGLLSLVRFAGLFERFSPDFEIVAP
jgi:alkyl sulfatase BDS1-like metallo-beta-lactamase superfamily hydrolase